MSEIVKKLGSWTLIRVVDKKRFRYKPVCKRCGKEVENGDFIWRHFSCHSKGYRKSSSIDYRCLNCFKKMWL